MENEKDPIWDKLISEVSGESLKDYITKFEKTLKNIDEKRWEDMKNKQRMDDNDPYYHLRTLVLFKIKSLFLTGNVNTTIGDEYNYDEKLMDSILCFNENVKKVDIDNKIFECLDRTKNKIHARKMPYSVMFINKKIEFTENIICFGIGAFYSAIGTDEINIIRLNGIDLNDNTEWRIFFKIKKDGEIIYGGSELFEEIKIEEIRNRIINLFVNIMDFFNHPEIVIKTSKWYNNENRIKKGKLPIPDLVNIKIKGKLYKYIYGSLPTQKNNRSTTHSFWVRGHYIHFWNKNKWNRIYKLDKDDLVKKGYQIDEDGVLSKWKLPFIKGYGILKNKPYILKNVRR